MNVVHLRISGPAAWDLLAGFTEGIMPNSRLVPDPAAVRLPSIPEAPAARRGAHPPRRTATTFSKLRRYRR